MSERSVLSLAAARRAIEAGEIDLLTGDVFDTLVWRPVAKPHQLFPRLAEPLGLPVDPAVVGHGRRRAERLARAGSKRVPHE